MYLINNFLIMLQEWYRVEYNGSVAFADSPIPDKVWGYFECPVWPELGSGDEESLVYDEVDTARGSSSKYGSMRESGKLWVGCALPRIICCSGPGDPDEQTRKNHCAQAFVLSIAK